MSKLLFTMTDAGRQELVNANKTGTNKVEIVSVGLGSRYYVTSTTQTEITDEIKRLTTIGGKVVSPDTIHVTAKDDSKDEYVVHTIGLYTNKGTLFAVYSQEQVIINKASSTIALISSDIAIKNLDTKNITFGDVEFINPPATETVVGVARFANEQEIDAGTDDSLAVSAKRLKQAIVKHEQSRNHPDATLTSKGIVQLSSDTNSTSETRAATPKAVKEVFDLAKQKQPADDTLTALAGLATAANKLPYFTGKDTVALADLTSVGRNILAKTSVLAVIQYLGLRELGTSGEKIPLLSTANTWSERQIFNGGLNGALTGNADTATKLKTARKINNVSFDGSSDITLTASDIEALPLEDARKIIQPLPDVWIPFNDSLDMITGFSPSYKKIVIGDDEITMPGDKVVKFKRASKATYINKSGVLTEAAIDEPRFERDGLLIEGQRTNYMLNSESPASWGRSSNMDVPETGTDSFGFTYGKFVCNDSLIGQTSAINMASIAATKSVDVSGDNKYVTTSCRFKTERQVRLRIRFDKYDGSATTFLGDAYIDTQTLEINMTGGAASRITARVRKDEATGWIFAEATIQAIDGELKIGSQIQYSPKQGGATVSGDYIYLATPQVEDGSCASSFIISGTTAATRASDIVTVPINNNLYNLPFTVLCEVHKNWYKTPNAAPRVFDTGGHQTGAAIILGFGSSADYDGFPYCDIGGANRRVNENASLEKMVMGMRVKSDQSTCSVSNGRISSETKTTWSYIQNSATIRIGGQTTAGLRHLFGHIRNFRIWHKALTDQQMAEVI
ncbi:phage tail fiber protein [Escherichia coli]|uniref:tail fiber protein n=1 Tax=Escherichia coli TaxID=562 RepID=UPI0010F32B25|nr:phage tail protein [Escherichia coli]ELU7963758.1 tail fiber protein [Shigella flexneri]EHQ9855108.1 tail fiber protein [Escherichia coli]EHS7087849.1 tail fiber protein [Escherichia coli]EIQ9627225.1 tail fiber protein [Escherichia coli]EIW6401229.1 tail fiber protein [Escherichia coli]